MLLDRFKFNRKFFIEVMTIALPLMFQQLIVSGVNLIDNLMVGYLGDAAIGGVGAVNRFYMIANFATFGMTMAGSVFIAQYFGAKNFSRLKETFRFMLIASAILNTVFVWIGIFVPNTVLTYFTDDAAVIRSGLDYMSIAIYSFFPLAVIISVNNAIRSVGDSRTPLITSVISMLFNVFLNYCLINGNLGFPAMGVKGAALATLLSRTIEFALCLILLKLKQYDFNTKIKDLFQVEWTLAKAILIKALPLCFNEILWSFGMATVFKFYSSRGLSVMSGYTAAMTIADLFFSLFGGMSMVTTVFVSQRLGANKIEEAKQVAYKLLGVSVILAVLFGIGLVISSLSVPILYANLSSESRAVAMNVLRIQSLMFWIYMFLAECYFILRSGGDMRNTLIMDSGFMWCVNIPILYLAANVFSLPYLPLFIAGQSADVIKLFFSYRMIRKEKWAKNLTV